MRAEPPVADSLHADPLTSTGWNRFEWMPSSSAPAGPAVTATSATAHGNGNGVEGRWRTEDQPAAEYTGRRRRPDSDTEQDTGGRSVNDPPASYGEDSRRHRHRRDDG
jgi:hypothetical protein